MKLLLVDVEKGNSKCPTYPAAVLKRGADEICLRFNDFILQHDERIKSEDIDINEKNLTEVIARVYKRKEYYKYFHNIENISELKEVALTIFWLIKLKPFTVLRKDSKLRSTVNEQFAFYLILSIIRYLADKGNLKFAMPSDNFSKDIIYTFKYRDLSKEAIIILVDSIACSYGIAIDSWI